MAKIVLVDDEMTLVQMVTEVLRSDGHQVIPFTNGLSAIECLVNIAPAVVLLHLASEKGGATGLGLVQKARSLNPPALVILITAPGSLQTAIDTMKQGAYDSLSKPFSLDELKLRLQRALSYHAALSEIILLRKQFEPPPHFQEIVGRSATIQDVLKRVQDGAHSDYPMLISGQTGTGKDLIGRTVHFNSLRRFAPFITVSCRSLPESPLEVELFGRPKVPFSPRLDEKPGLFQEAEGGTIFLDDIGALSVALQDRLLSVLQDRQIRPDKYSVPTPIDVRVLCATEHPLDQSIARGTFMSGLYDLLNQFSITLPTLRERVEDLPLLISHFLEGKIHPRTGKSCAIVPEAIEACRAYLWPGNVRELKNALDQACILCQDNMIQLSDFPLAIQAAMPVTAPALTPPPRNSHPEITRSLDLTEGISRSDSCTGSAQLAPLKQFLRDQEVTHLQRALAQVGGSKDRAAELLGISLATSVKRQKRYLPNLMTRRSRCMPDESDSPWKLVHVEVQHQRDVDLPRRAGGDRGSLWPAEAGRVAGVF